MKSKLSLVQRNIYIYIYFLNVPIDEMASIEKCISRCINSSCYNLREGILEDTCIYISMYTKVYFDTLENDVEKLAFDRCYDIYMELYNAVTVKRSLFRTDV